MNALEIVDTNDMRGATALFYERFSARITHAPVAAQPAQRSHELGQHGPLCPLHSTPHVQPDGKTWRDQLPLRLADPDRPARDELVTPHGFSQAWHTLTFHDRNTELSWLIQSQTRELAPLAQEMKANGMSAISLSSSPDGTDDDDLTAANIAEMHLKRVPYDPDPVELADRRRTYEWEQTVLRSGQSTRIYARRNKDGNRVLASSDHRDTPATLAPYAPKVLALIGDRSLEDLENDRARAAYYKAIVWAAMTPEEQAAWAARAPEVRYYLDFADDNVARETTPEPEPGDGGPQEIGFHADDTPQEPTELDLWPLTDKESAAGIESIQTAIAQAEAEYFYR